MTSPQFVQPRPTPPQVSGREDSRSPSKANDAQRRAFEKLLSEEETEAADTAADTTGHAEWGLAPLPTFSTMDEDSPLPGQDLAPTPPAVAAPCAAAEAPADIQVPAPYFPPAPAPAQQAGLYSHLALPHGQAAEMGRFEVLDGSMVSRVELNATPQGGMTVTVGTSVQHASLLDRYLPQLQRRLPEKVAAHVRVQERDRSRD